MVLDLMHIRCFLLSDGSGFGKNVIIYGAYMGSSVHVINKKIYFNSWSRFNVRIKWYYNDCRRILYKFY